MTTHEDETDGTPSWFAAFSADLMWALDAVEEDRRAVRDGLRTPPGAQTNA